MPGGSVLWSHHCFIRWASDHHPSLNMQSPYIHSPTQFVTSDFVTGVRDKTCRAALCCDLNIALFAEYQITISASTYSHCVARSAHFVTGDKKRLVLTFFNIKFIFNKTKTNKKGETLNSHYVHYICIISVDNTHVDSHPFWFTSKSRNRKTVIQTYLISIKSSSHNWLTFALCRKGYRCEITYTTSDRWEKCKDSHLFRVNICLNTYPAKWVMGRGLPGYRGDLQRFNYM